MKIFKNLLLEDLGDTEGEKHGLEQGMKQGIEQTKHDVAINLYTQGISLDVISNATNLSISEINNIIITKE